MDVAAEHQNLSEATAAFEELRKAWEAQGPWGPWCEKFLPYSRTILFFIKYYCKDDVKYDKL